jgi:hypothetical protein
MTLGGAPASALHCSLSLVLLPQLPDWYNMPRNQLPDPCPDPARARCKLQAVLLQLQCSPLALHALELHSLEHHGGSTVHETTFACVLTAYQLRWPSPSS